MWLFEKFSKWFCLLASVAGFCFNWFRHGFLLIRKSCLGPIASYTLAVGSLYCNSNKVNFKYKSENF